MSDAERGIWKALQRASTLFAVLGFFGITGAAGLAGIVALGWDYLTRAAVPPSQIPEKPPGPLKEDKVSESGAESGKSADPRSNQTSIPSTNANRTEMPGSWQDNSVEAKGPPVVAKGGDEIDDTSLRLRGPRQGWVFAGSYLTPEYYTGPYFQGSYTLRTKLGWVNKYLEFDSGIKPKDLKGKTLSSINRSNLRNDHPTSRGAAPIIGSVDSTAQLVVRDVYVQDRGKEVWLKVDVFGNVTLPNQKLVTPSSP